MQIEQTKQYLAKVLPWPEDASAHVFLVYTSKNNDKKFFNTRPVRDMQDAVRQVEYRLLHGPSDIYACMSSQTGAREEPNKKGTGTYLKGQRFTETAHRLKAFYLDIDVKDGAKGYTSLIEAAGAFDQFRRAVGLPPASMVVSSGGGVHIYWTIATPLPRHEWQPIAYALAEAGIQHGLKFDTQCTVDAARILRIPGTFNHKTTPAQPVRIQGTPLDFDYLLEKITEPLTPYIGKARTHTSPTTPLHFEQPADLPSAVIAPRPGVSDLAAGIDRDFKPIHESRILCPTILDAIHNGGGDHTQPLWNLMALAATFIENGRDVLHDMSSAHAGYDEENTDDLYDRKVRERENRNFGWPSCAQVELAGSKHCATCPLKAEGKGCLSHVKPLPSPVQFVPAASASGRVDAPPASPLTQQAVVGSVAAPTPTVQWDMPTGYVRLTSGLVARIVAEEDGTQKQIPVCSYPLTDAWLTPSPWTLHFRATTKAGRPLPLTMPFKSGKSADTIYDMLSDQGLALEPFERKMMVDFMSSWMKQLQAAKNAVISGAALGWNESEGVLDGFSYGGSVWTPNGARPSAIADPQIARHYQPVGEVDPWKAAADLITSQGRPELDAVIASAFAAPLVRFTGEAGLLLSAFSKESGIGKSTAMKVAQAVWGDPIRGVQGLIDTGNSVTRKIGQLNSLPVYWDELKTEEDTRKFVNIVFQLTLGKEKSRLNQNSTLKEAGSWQTMLICASNDSLMDFILSKTKTTTAGLLRLFEYPVKPGTKGQINVADAQRIVLKLNNNFGQIGLQYAQYLGANFDKVDEGIGALQKTLMSELNAGNDERFWISTITTLLAGATIANKMGFTRIDLAGLRRHLIGVLNLMRGHRRDQPVDLNNTTNVSAILGQFLNAMRSKHTLYTNRFPAGKGKPAKGEITIVGSTMKLEALHVHIARDMKRLRINSTAFSDWCQSKDLSRSMITASLKEKFGMRSTVACLGAGTEFVVMKDHILEIDLAGTPEADFIDAPDDVANPATIPAASSATTAVATVH